MERKQEKKSELRTARYDAELKVEAYQFQGVMQAFPNHFHEHYVIGCIERGRRKLTCMGVMHIVAPGDLVLFNPGDNHACESADHQPLDYRCINIERAVFQNAAREITGDDSAPVFSQAIVFHSDLIGELKELHSMILRGETGVQKEERFYFLLEQLLSYYAQTNPQQPPEQRREVRAVCDYLNQHYAESISLDALSALAGLSKYHLLRAFTRETGITPYSYLETIRIDRAKALLRLDTPPAEAAQETGFSDQSHFSNTFKRFIGLTPGQYRGIFSAERAQNKGEQEDT